MQEGSQVFRFRRLMPKGEKILSPKQKQKDHTKPPFHISKFLQMFAFQLVFKAILIGMNFQIGIYFKTLLKAKGRISFRGAFV
jgi:hypothetical protein